MVSIEFIVVLKARLYVVVIGKIINFNRKLTLN